MTAQEEQRKKPKSTWVLNVNPVGAGADPARNHEHETLATAIHAAANGSGELDALVVYRKHGRGGWQPTEISLSPNPEAEEIDSDEAAELLLQRIDAHKDAEGPGDYQVRGQGKSARGNPKTIFSMHIDRGGAKGQEKGHREIEGGDILRYSKEMIAEFKAVNSALLTNIERISGQAVQAYSAASEANQKIVDLERLKVETRKWEIEMQQKEQEADREAKLSEKRMEHGVTVLGMVADGFMAHMANKGGTEVKRGDAANSAIEKVFSTLTAEEKAAAKEAVGEEIWDLFEAARNEKRAQQRNALFKELRRRFDALDDDEKSRRGQELAAAIGPQRVSILMAAIRSAG